MCTGVADKFLQALDLAGWKQQLSRPSLAMTVFAPNDDAIDRWLAAISCASLQAVAVANKTLLRDVLAVHLVPAYVPPMPGAKGQAPLPAVQPVVGVLWSRDLAGNADDLTLPTAPWYSQRAVNASGPTSNPFWAPSAAGSAGSAAPIPRNSSLTVTASASKGRLPGAISGGLYVTGPGNVQGGDSAGATSQTHGTSLAAVAGPAASVLINDLAWCRGVVHVIDAVLLPYAGAAGTPVCAAP